jgi:hypothetical protein
MRTKHRYREVLNQVEAACLSVGRVPSDVQLIAVSKLQPVEAILELYELGHRDFGESRVQELETKAARLPADIRWHFIGPLQSNKFAKAAQMCSCIQSLSRESQLAQLAKLSHPINVFIQVNIDKEAQKSGIFPDGVDLFAKEVLQYKQANLLGLMTIGQVTHEKEQKRATFRQLKQLAVETGLNEVSMGMSSDFDVAIQEGSTCIRVGTALFTER